MMTLLLYSLDSMYVCDMLYELFYCEASDEFVSTLQTTFISRNHHYKPYVMMTTTSCEEDFIVV